jgi:LuxR family maltose regulon positive regulatory protein
MQRPLIPSKLVPPPRPICYLPRTRLDGLWGDWAAARLVRVTAGAGYGKTSFLAAGVAASSRPVHWYSLDELDTETLPFARHLFAAVTGGESSATDPHDVLAETVRHLHADGANAVLVLDDVQFVGGAPGVVGLIEKLVRYLPRGCTLVVASREPLDLPVAKLGAAGLTTEVTAAELAFTADEVAALFRSRGIELDAALAERVVLRTEGWAVGLEILLQGLAAPTTAALAEALDMGRGDGPGWFAYFAEEVLQRLPADLRRFLRCAALLPRLDPELCDAALGRSDSLQVLADLHRRRLFVLRAGGRDRYRLHHLFRDFLRDVQAREGTVRERNEVQRRAAAVL